VPATGNCYQTLAYMPIVGELTPLTFRRHGFYLHALAVQYDALCSRQHIRPVPRTALPSIFDRVEAAPPMLVIRFPSGPQSGSESASFSKSHWKGFLQDVAGVEEEELGDDQSVWKRAKRLESLPYM
jgi:hypothetical protein